MSILDLFRRRTTKPETPARPQSQHPAAITRRVEAERQRKAYWAREAARLRACREKFEGCGE